MHQLQLIIEFTGTPSLEDTEYIANEKAKAWIRSISYRPPQSLTRLFPRASPEALIYSVRCHIQSSQANQCSRSLATSLLAALARSFGRAGR